ncbi:hypothetical protein CG51_11925 [Haematobacter missouriensis]|uniref:Nonribosomal peptide synthetase MxaA n=1 Tax=Haematobacter missouriensis TaxID=366616 RepID=A0A212AN01_9RHOB|nr:hypothetical protein [Haematobacter missouriensis]KFI26547.1 hypothetical protein CG51_11925 [Haematobacter missouriensis]OWJ72886.1 nonribosomal peptide synthetase MxaA [Haematobacter missouriensis]OWJ82890.1 nonribosomal peptide synthetase MxaA [Haematobacter missouriensis]
MRKFALLWVLWLSGLPGIAGAAVDYSVEPPRGYGWWLGDRLVHSALLLPPDGFEIDRASLPAPRAADYWLDLVDVTVDEVRVNGHAAWRVTTEWQNFYAALEPSRQRVPGYRLRFLARDGSGRVEEAEIPSWDFVTSPIRPILAPSAIAAMQPDVGVRPLATLPLFRGAAGFGLFALLALSGMAWQQGWWPFHQRAERPLTRALRQVRRARDARTQALALHRGLNAANGGPLLASDLDGFLSRHPEFDDLRAELRGFFDASARMFYGDGTGGGAEALPLARHLARREGGRA